MSNLFDYLSWRGDLDFISSPFNPVDSVIFSQLSYLPFDGIVSGPDEKKEITVSRAADIFSKRPEGAPAVMFKDDPAFLSALGSSKRFGNCRLRGYVNHVDTDREIQFSALCVITGDDSCFIVFRGTDANFVGWKEDFNMCFSEVIPAQLEAADYLEKMAGNINGPLRLGGHSKGGNLAVYAASHCGKSTQLRITDIYSNDAPGFHEKVLASEGFAAIREKIHSFVPQSSVVGMLLEHGNNYTVIKSSQIGLLQHSLYSWEVMCNDMIHADKITRGSRFVDKTLREWIGSLDAAHREQFFDALYNILGASQAKSIHELESSWFKAAGLMLKSISNIDNSTKTLIRKTLKALIRSAGNNITMLNPVINNDE
ncbi:MAG: DUF2974 domain-containing protein [Treponema sp.]|jgi:hypothetical protein|nr:DUF2974 domain-containing protein [Treponema sp.]